jgi:uncharacterized protein (TIGR00255 family)
MVLSMTGYGNSVLETPDLLIRVEIKSLNSRGLDLSVRVPRNYSEKEITLRSILGHRFQRGKVSVYIDMEATGSKIAKKAMNWDLLMEYYKELKAKAESVGAPTDNLLPALVSLSDINQSPAQVASEDDDWPLIEKALNEAMDNFDSFRKAEGEALHKELISYIENIAACLEKVIPLKDKRIEKIKDDLREKLASIQEEGRIDENRFEQELIYFAEKLDITEEIVRLGTHLKYFAETLNEAASGKKLGFISQEIGREINTIGSKANDASIQKDIVLMKEELEKIKEQCLNVL